MKKTGLALLFTFIATFLFAAENNSLLELFPEQLINSHGRKIDTKTALQGKKLVAVYYSASWCGPCRGFTPNLVKFYKQVAKSNGLEVILVGSDRKEKDMMNYMKKDSMPWLAVPFDDPSNAGLKKLGKVRGIPQLTILDSTGKIVSQNARWDVVILGKDAVKAWMSPDYTPKTYQDYKDSSQNNKNKKSSKKSSKKKRSKKR